MQCDQMVVIIVTDSLNEFCKSALVHMDEWVLAASKLHMRVDLNMETGTERCAP